MFASAVYLKNCPPTQESIGETFLEGHVPLSAVACCAKNVAGISEKEHAFEIREVFQGTHLRLQESISSFVRSQNHTKFIMSAIDMFWAAPPISRYVFGACLSI